MNNKWVAEGIRELKDAATNWSLNPITQEEFQIAVNEVLVSLLYHHYTYRCQYGATIEDNINNVWLFDAVDEYGDFIFYTHAETERRFSTKNTIIDITSDIIFELRKTVDNKKPLPAIILIFFKSNVCLIDTRDVFMLIGQDHDSKEELVKKVSCLKDFYQLFNFYQLGYDITKVLDVTEEIIDETPIKFTNIENPQTFFDYYKYFNMIKQFNDDYVIDSDVFKKYYVTETDESLHNSNLTNFIEKADNLTKMNVLIMLGDLDNIVDITIDFVDELDLDTPDDEALTNLILNVASKSYFSNTIKMMIN